MDPHANEHVMVGHKIFVTWVCFTNHLVRGMLLKWSWGWEDGVQAKHVMVGTFVPNTFISFGLLNNFSIFITPICITNIIPFEPCALNAMI